MQQSQIKAVQARRAFHLAAVPVMDSCRKRKKRALLAPRENRLLTNSQTNPLLPLQIDFYLTVGTTMGKAGERRVVLTFNGKFLPFIEQRAEDNTAARASSQD
mmetsp:Transcript_17277/g.52234  ORF Transcript_17277/g.52234 Transcript_17277/m.52234 type:complete len:103 (-) Transcript_17277:747-1055(-)